MAVTPKKNIDDHDVERELKDLEIGVKPAATISFAAGALNVTNVTVQLKDAFGNNLAERRYVELYMTQDVNGAGLTAAAYSGAIAAVTGVILTQITAKKHFNGQT